MKKTKKKRKVKKIIVLKILLIITICLIYIFLHIKNKKQNMQATKIEQDDINKETIEVDAKVQKRTNPTISDWKLILVNKNNKLPEDYDVKLETLENGNKVDIRIIEQLKSMLNDARTVGLNPLICSSYRTNYAQKQLYDRKIKQYQNNGYNIDNAKELASFWVAVPGTSEHELGLAVDIVSKSYQILDEKQEETEVQKWLIENSYKYGFILRYPTKKKDITMINYEPWHYRYVGIENAKYMKENDMCLEEYIEYKIINEKSIAKIIQNYVII